MRELRLSSPSEARWEVGEARWSDAEVTPVPLEARRNARGHLISRGRGAGRVKGGTGPVGRRMLPGLTSRPGVPHSLLLQLSSTTTNTSGHSATVVTSNNYIIQTDNLITHVMVCQTPSIPPQVPTWPPRPHASTLPRLIPTATNLIPHSKKIIKHVWKWMAG